MNKNKAVLLPLLFTICYMACKKDSKGPDTPKSPGVLEAKIDNEMWAGHTFKAYYYNRYHQLFVVGYDAGKKYLLQLVAAVDSVNPVMGYAITPGGTHYASLRNECNFGYYTDIDDNALSGNIELLKLDTTGGKVSGRFQFKAYNQTRKDYIVMSEGRFEDIELDTIQVPYDGSFLTCEVNGNSWYSADVFGQIFAASSTEGPSLTITASAATLTEMFFPECYVPGNRDMAGRYLHFEVPLKKGAGTYTLTPDTEPYSWQWDQYHLNKFVVRNENPYLPVTGSITISTCDTVTRRIEATFAIQANDTANQAITISNGKLVLNGWPDMR